MWKNKNKTKTNQRKENWAKPKQGPFHFHLIEDYFSGKEEEHNAYTLGEQSLKDLDFNDFFQFIDRTNSAIGQQYLYYRLRQGKSTSTQLEALEERIDYYTQEDQHKFKVQEVLSELSQNYDFYFPFLIFGKLPSKISFLWLVKTIQFLFYVLLLAGILFNPIFFLPLILIFCINIVLHYWHKNRIGNFAHIFSRLVRLSKTSKKLLKHSNLSDQEKSNFLKNTKRIDQITSKILLLKTETLIENEVSSIVWYFFELFKIVTLLEITSFHSIVDDLETSRNEIDQLFIFIGEVDLAISVASLRAGLPYFCQPTFTPKQKAIELNALYHPLIDACIENDIHLVNKSLLLTGSNMSGKSTFIRAVNLNTLAAQTINTSFTKKSKTPILAIASSIRIADNINEDKSYYMEEVSSIGQLIECSNQVDFKCLFTIDEVFKGTNTIERISSAKAILEYLNKEDHLVLVSTHDIELTLLLKENFELHYFQESIEQEHLSFDYKLRQGALKKKNAIKILELAGYPKEIVEEAKKLTIIFEKDKTGEKD